MSSYYRDMAKVFFDTTYAIDMSELYAPFLEHLPQQATILDAGCGSGRDALAFFKQGYQVQAFDTCPELVQLARQHTGLDIQCASFADFHTETTTFHGIWACASLLHLPFSQLPETFRHLAQFLIPGGVFYCSFKYGDDEIDRGGRHFTNLNEQRMAEVVSTINLKIKKTWQTEDRRPDRTGEFWLNGLLVME